MDKDKIQMEFERGEVIDLIKKYYHNTYQVKDIKVLFYGENIIDRLKEADLFHREDLFYNTIVRTIITGKIQDKEGAFSRFREELDVEGTKDLIKNAYSSKYCLEDVNIQVSFRKNCNDGFDVIVNSVTGNVDKRILTKRI